MQFMYVNSRLIQYTNYLDKIRHLIHLQCK